MNQTRIRKALGERDSALLESMLLAAQVAEPLDEAELRGVMAVALEDPQFQGEQPDALLARLEACARHLAQASDAAIFASLRSRLPGPRNRLLAYGLSMKAAAADDSRLDLAARYLGLLQLELGVSSAQGREMLLQLAGGAAPSEAAAEPPAHMHQRVLEMLLLAVGLEASLTEAEVAALHGAQEDEAHFRKLVARQLRRLASGGSPEQPQDAVLRHLEALVLAPATPTQRREAWLLAARFSEALGPDLFRARLLDCLRELFGLEGAPGADGVWPSAPAEEPDGSGA